MPSGPQLPKLTALAGLGIVASGVLYLTLYGSDSSTHLLSPGVAADRIDLYVEQPRGSKFNADGRRVQTFSATRMTHFLSSNHSEMAMPQFQIFTKRGEIWNGTSTTAVLIADNEIRLRDNVVIVDGAGTTRLTSQELNYFPKDEKVNSAVRINMKRATDTTQAVGMRADLNTNRVELLSRVEGVHVVP